MVMITGDGIDMVVGHGSSHGSSHGSITWHTHYHWSWTHGLYRKSLVTAR